MINQIGESSAEQEFPDRKNDTPPDGIPAFGSQSKTTPDDTVIVPELPAENDAQTKKDPVLQTVPEFLKIVNREIPVDTPTETRQSIGSEIRRNFCSLWLLINSLRVTGKKE